ncbi:MAG TPA: HD domain-containing protein [Steroidobacteraceae bacterium]|jgi:gamma-butyrobetaine dioxygenase|nr:HD domain-containing protein [Steroidobacteraceae bacterium]
MSVSDEIFSLYAARGAAAYFGEAVSMTEHGLQAAHFAELARARETVVVAALLHDVGHLIATVPDDIEEWTVDARHEATGARWLGDRFGRDVSEPVRLHVRAKRYLCATDPTYFSQLSPASVHTLRLQGGPMSAAEVAGFEAEPGYRDAIVVRRCDDRGKVAGLATRRLEDYRALLESLAARGR